MNRLTINIFYPIWLAAAITLGILGIVSWWVIALIIASHFKAQISFNLK